MMLINRIRGFVLIFSGILLLILLSVIPFSNWLSTVPILFLIFGILQVDRCALTFDSRRRMEALCDLNEFMEADIPKLKVLASIRT